MWKRKANFSANPAAIRMEVASGVDWFELHGEVQYGETTAALPELLEAVRRGENTVRLGDGTYGVLPEEWLSRIGLVAGLGTAEMATFVFAAIRRACWTRCSPPSPRFLATRLSSACASSWALSRRSRGRATSGIP